MTDKKFNEFYERTKDMFRNAKKNGLSIHEEPFFLISCVTINAGYTFTTEQLKKIFELMEEE